MRRRCVTRAFLGFIFMNLVIFAFAGRILSDDTNLRVVVHRVPTHEKVVALTYDDGPDPRFTPKLLKVLAKYKVKATFFMIGRLMEKNPKIVKQVVKNGNVIGNHTYTHPHDIELDSESQIAAELAKGQKVIERLVGKRSYLFRPPRGLVDGTVLSVASKGDYETILWTVCGDHHDAPTPKLMAKRVLDRVEPGAIILLHDGRFGTRWKDVAATPLIIEALKKQGYRFVTIPELLEMDSHNTSKVSPAEQRPANSPQTKTENRRPRRA